MKFAPICAICAICGFAFLPAISAAAPPKASFSDVQTSALTVGGPATVHGALWGGGQRLSLMGHYQNGDTGTMQFASY